MNIMKKIILLLVITSGYSLFGYTTKIYFNESARKGGTFRVTAHVDIVGPVTKEITPSDTPYDLGTPAANCINRYEVEVVGGEFDGAKIDAPITLASAARCMNRTMRFAKAGELVQTNRAFPIFTSSDGKLAVEFRPQ